MPFILTQQPANLELPYLQPPSPHFERTLDRWGDTIARYLASINSSFLLATRTANQAIGAGLTPVTVTYNTVTQWYGCDVAGQPQVSDPDFSFDAATGIATIIKPGLYYLSHKVLIFTGAAGVLTQGYITTTGSSGVTFGGEFTVPADGTLGFGGGAGVISAVLVRGDTVFVQAVSGAAGDDVARATFNIIRLRQIP